MINQILFYLKSGHVLQLRLLDSDIKWLDPHRCQEFELYRTGTSFRRRWQGHPNYFALILNSFRGIWSPGAGMGEQKTMLQHVEHTMRDVGRIKSLLDSILRKVLNLQLCYCGINILKIFTVFGSSPVIFETSCSEDRTERMHDALCWSWLWRTPNSDRVTVRVAWVQEFSGRAIPLISTFSHCSASNSFRDLITEFWCLITQGKRHFGGNDAVA